MGNVDRVTSDLREEGESERPKVRKTESNEDMGNTNKAKYTLVFL